MIYKDEYTIIYRFSLNVYSFIIFGFDMISFSIEFETIQELSCLYILNFY